MRDSGSNAKARRAAAWALLVLGVAAAAAMVALKLRPEFGAWLGSLWLPLLGVLGILWLILSLRYAALARRHAVQAEQALAELAAQTAAAERMRSALDESRHDLASVLDSVTDAFYLVDSQWRFVYVNAEAERLMGASRETLMGRSLWDQFPDVVDSDAWTVMQRAVREQTSASFEFDYPPLGWFAVRVYPHRAGLAVYFHEITQAKQNQAALQRMQRQTERAQQLARLGSWEFEPASGRLRWSRQVSELFGLPHTGEPAARDVLLRLVHPEDAPAVRRAWQAWLAGEANLDIEYRVLRHDGTLRHAHELGTLMRDGDGRIVDGAGSIQDISERRRAQEALQEATRRLEHSVSLNRMIMDSSLDVICAIDNNGRFATVSAASERIWGYPPAELNGRPYLELVHPDDHAATEAQVERVKAGEPTIDFRNRVLTPEGRAVAMQWSAIWSERDRLMFTVGRDVTEVERQKEDLVALKDRLLRAQQVAQLGSWEIHLDENRLVWSDEVFRMFGVTPDKFGGTFNDFSSRVYPEDVPALLIAYDHVISGAGEFDVEHRIVLPDGRIRHVHERARLLRDAEGRPWKLSGSVQDITERTLAEHALRESEQRFKLVARITTDTMWDWQVMSDTLWWSDGLSGLFGYRPSDVTPGAAFWTDRIHPDDHARVLEGFDQALSQGDSWQDEYRFRRRDGSYAHVLDRALVIRDEHGRAVRMVGGMSDRTERRKAEEALMRERRFLAALLENLSDGVVACDAEGTLTTVNRATREFHGQGQDAKDPADWVAHFDLYQPDGTPLRPDRAPLRRALQGEPVVDVEVVVAPRNRPHRLLSCNGQQIVTAEGELLGAVVAMHDITARRSAERFEAAQRAILTGIAAQCPLQQSLDALVRLYEEQHPHSLCSILLLDAAGEHILHAAAPNLPEEYNRAINGVRIGETAGSCGTAAYLATRVVVRDIASDPRWIDYAPLALAHGLRACWSTPVISSHGTVLATFAVYYREPAEPTPAELAAVDSMAAMAAIAIEQEQAYRQISLSEQRFRSLFAEHPDAVYSMDLEGRFTSYNNSFHALSGFSDRTILGTTFDKRIMPAELAAVREQFHAAAAGEARTFETNVLLPQGGTVALRVTNLPIVVDGKVTGVFGIAHDITERKRAENALQRAFEDLRIRNRELQDFAFVASHDLQEPLRKIRAFSDRLLSRHADQLDAQGQDYLQRSAQAAVRMQALIDDLLAYSRVNSGGRPFAPVDLGALAANVVDDLEARLESSRGRIEIGPLPVIDGDARQLQQLLQNLLANALKFRAAERDPLVRIEAEPVVLDDERPGFEIRISDNGIGFDPKYTERIFAPFQRLHGRHEYEGTGIGLAIVRRIVERHRGSIAAHGRPGEGACFVLRLPERQPVREDETAPDPTVSFGV